MPLPYDSYRYGDHLAAYDLFYSHHGIYISESVIHLNKQEGIRITSVEDFAQEREIRVIQHTGADPDKTVNRAVDMMLHFDIPYHLLFWNCETFCLAALGLLPISKQVIHKTVKLLEALFYGR